MRMPSLYIVCMLFTLGISQVSMGQSFEKGDIIVNAGIGLGTTFSFGFGGLGLPLGGGVEVGITDAIGIGGEVGFVSGRNITVFYIGPKGYYHFNELLNIDNDALDIYGGLAIYYRNFNIKGFSGIPGFGAFGLSSGITVGFHIGGRYYFTDKFGVNAELGNSYGWLKLGVCLKF